MGPVLIRCHLLLSLSFSVLISLCTSDLLYSQEKSKDKGSLSGSFQSSSNLFIRDSLIGAANIPQYDNERFGTQAWLELGYNYQGFDLGVRFDMFNNSNLLNPTQSYTDEGIGRWHIAKSLDKFNIRVGHIYDQIGSGIIYRAYEERALLIDNALLGARVIYTLSDDWSIKAFAGRQRFLFDTYDPTIRGANLDGFINLTKDTTGATIFTLAPGIGVVNRTLNRETVDAIGSAIRNYSPEDQFELFSNTYSFTLYNTLTVGPFSFFAEVSQKSAEAFFDPDAPLRQLIGPSVTGGWVRERGQIYYGSLSYAGHGLGITLEAKRTENFDFRSDPQLSLLQGLITFIPPMNRANTYRLTARYSPATQTISEQAYQADIRYRVNKKLSLLANYSFINSIEGEKLFRELFTEVAYKPNREWQLKGGLQLVNYNQERYEIKPEVPIVETITPYMDILYKISRKKSIRLEMQYMLIGDDEKAGLKQDYGDWLFFLVEYGVAPNWSFVVSDMYNSSAGKNTPIGDNGERVLLHYPRFDIYYTKKANRFSLSYIKQVEGIVCNGGVCRLEPAFSGINFSINSTF